jgi:hypothetical protein
VALSALNRSHANLLVEFHEAGGSGDLDVYGRVLAGTPRRFMAGEHHVAWLTLVARGLIGGEDGKIVTTEDGRIEAQRLIAGRTVTGA